MRIVLVAAAMGALAPGAAATNAVQHEYTNSVVLVSNMGSDLYGSLEERFQKGLRPDPVKVEKMEAPVVTPIKVNDGEKEWAEVSISVGFIDMINHLAHAKAIDEISPGFFNRYVLDLAREGGSNSAAWATNMVDSRYWTEDVMNRQKSYFNGMIGMSVALSLSHHYLGRYDKYASQMLAGKLAPINNFLPTSSWEYDVKAATLDCLNYGVPVEGAKALFEAIDKMPTRPAWTAFIVPPDANLKKTSKQLDKYQDDFFHGKLNLNDWK